MTNLTYISRTNMARIERKPSKPDSPLWVWGVWIGLFILIVNGIG